MVKKKKDTQQRTLGKECLASSTVPFVGWPAFPESTDALTLSLLHQFEQSEWWPSKTLRAYQYSQLRLLLKFARENSTHYREILDGFELDNPKELANNWQSIPLTSRVDLQTKTEQMRCSDLPHGHFPVTEGATSGSTGKPITFLATPVTGLFFNALNLRNQFWHERNFSGRVVSIRADRPSYDEKPKPRKWARGYRTGPVYRLDIQTPAHLQLDWIRNRKPDRMVTYPSNVLQLAKTSISKGIKLPTLKEISTMGEVVTPAIRKAARQAWGVPIIDCYSCKEAGILALQCPEQEGTYHIQSESVLLEILDEKGQPCESGTIGKVVITVLHNFAQPLIRYEIGDYAEAGPPCSCGRGLPTLGRVVGRSRNLMVLDDGRHILPDFKIRNWASIAPISEVQIVQKTVDHIEVRAVVHRKLSDDEKTRLKEYICSALKRPIHVSFVFRDKINRMASGKLEEFICLISN